MRAAACVLAYFAVAAVAPARTITNEKLGVTLEVPEGWSELPEMAQAVPPAAELIAGLADPADGCTFTALSVALKPNETAGYTKGLLSSLTKQGFTLRTNTPVTINGVDFDSYTGTRAGADIPVLQVFSAFGNGRAYALSLYSHNGDPMLDAELRGLVESFRFLTPPKPLSKTGDADRIGYEVGRIVGMLLGSAILIGAGYFFLRKKKQ